MVLCLHGCRQDAKTFNQKTGQFRKMFKNFKVNVNFDYMSAPHSIKSFEDNDDYDYRSWWYTGEDKTYSSKEPSEIDEGFEESVRLIQNYIKDNGPYHGVLGFSQGASLLAIICLMIERKEFDADFKFVIIVSGFKSPCVPHEKYYSTISAIPSLHVIGDSDSIISKERSEHLMSFFENPNVIHHPGGHHVPAGKGLTEQYLTFFNKILSNGSLEIGSS